MGKDPAVFGLIAKEKERQTSGIELIASENFVSESVLEAMGSVLTNKYAEGLPGKRYYGGCEIVDEIESLAISRACELFGAAWANVQPHSGASANAAVMMSILKPGDKILGFDLSHGGHLTHGSPVNFSGKLYEAHFYGVEADTGRVDMSKVREKALQVKPSLIICGASAYSRDWDYASFRAIADETGALLLADIAHPAGLIAANLLNDPLPHCHFVTTTTHKTLRGPRGGMIMMGNDFPNTLGITTPKGELRPMSAVIDSGVFPGLQGGPLEHVIAAKAVAFGEALESTFADYGRQVVTNAQRLCQALTSNGYSVVSGGTDNHCFLLVLSETALTGKEADAALGKAGITVNKNMVPFDKRSPLVTSGIRIGTPAVTTRGMREAEMERIAVFIDRALKNSTNDSELAAIHRDVRQFAGHFPLFAG